MCLALLTLLYAYNNTDRKMFGGSVYPTDLEDFVSMSYSGMDRVIFPEEEFSYCFYAGEKSQVIALDSDRVFRLSDSCYTKPIDEYDQIDVW